MELRTSQIETLRIADHYSDGMTDWDLATSVGITEHSAQRRIERLVGSGHLTEHRMLNLTLYGLTDLGRKALEQSGKEQADG